MRPPLRLSRLLRVLRLLRSMHPMRPQVRRERRGGLLRLTRTPGGHDVCLDTSRRGHRRVGRGGGTQRIAQCFLLPQPLRAPLAGRDVRQQVCALHGAADIERRQASCEIDREWLAFLAV